MARDNLRCLPSSRTLRRIRWPLQPRSRDRRTAFQRIRRPLDDSLKPPWVLAGPAPFTSAQSDTPDIVSSDTVSDTLVPVAAPPRPPFTRTATLFESAACELIRGQDAACRLLQLHTTYGRKIRGSRFLAGTVAMTTFLFLRLTHDPLELPRMAVRRGEPRIRPFVPIPVPVPPGYPGLPDRDTEPTATPRPD
jgi:hypothetical protein